MVLKTRISPSMSMRKSVITAPRKVLKVGRNEPCPCGSGAKFKNCCESKGDVFLKKMALKVAKIEHQKAKEEEKKAKLAAKKAEKK